MRKAFTVIITIAALTGIVAPASAAPTAAPTRVCSICW